MTTDPQKDRQYLIDEVLRLGKQSFDPSIPQDSQLRQSNLEKFKSLLDSTSTLLLLPVLTLLINSDRIFAWLKEPLSSALAHLPLRNGGVQDAIEFVLSVHPSTTSVSASRVGKGSFISHEALNAVSRLLSSPPAGVSAEVWFHGISPQLLSLLQGDGEPEMDRAAAFIIGFGILGKKQYGSPGRSGWKAFVEPIFAHLYPSNFDIKVQEQSREKVEGIETIRPRKILSTPIEVAQSLQKLTALLTSHPHPSLSIRLLTPLLPSLWTISSWPDGDERTEKLYRKPARKLLVTLLQLWPTKKDPAYTSLITKILDIIAIGQNKISTQVGWKYAADSDGGIQIEKVSINDQITNISDLETIDHALDSFIALLKNLPELNAEIPALFICLSSKWLTKKPQASSIKAIDENLINLVDIRRQLVEAKAMQKMLAALPERLIDDSKQLLDLVSQVLQNFNQSRSFEIEIEIETETGSGSGSENILSIALSLFNTILTTPKFRVTKDLEPLVDSIQKDLKIISGKRLSDISRTAGNLLMLLNLHDTINEPEANLSTKEILYTDEQLEAKKTYSLAISYLKGLDSPPPVRVQGLELLSQLVQANSSILDIPALIMLLMSLLGDNEEYVHLRVIQLLVQVSRKHPKTVIKEIIDRYVDSNEELNLDERLRLGEALEQIIQINSSAFKLEIAQTVCQGLIFLASRRGYRPKTAQRQEKEKLHQRSKNAEAEEAWGGPVPQLDEPSDNVDVYVDVDADGNDNDPKTHALLAQIVSGWESKRGSEDVRIRASALTILGTAIEAHIAGITSSLLSAAVDVSIHVLTLERAVEMAILRRASILLLMHLVRALDAARERGQRLGFGLVGQGLADLQRILTYIASTDRDSLVQQHAKHVCEELDTWHIKSLLPVHQSPQQNLTPNLPQLRSSPQDLEGSSGRPRIEEIE
ncbi:hypothetical protein K3495_g5114 [Podosphaera aphanis]|nr:hypothetical protein K3495_g5114 [Podosphaera aphanis]